MAGWILRQRMQVLACGLQHTLTSPLQDRTRAVFTPVVALRFGFTTRMHDVDMDVNTEERTLRDCTSLSISRFPPTVAVLACCTKSAFPARHTRRAKRPGTKYQ